MENHENVRKNLLQLLRLFPEIKNNYNQILQYYWAIYDNVTDLSEIQYATPAETITRNFRKLVQTGQIKLSEDELKRRKRLQEEYRQEFSSNSTVNEFSTLI